MQKLFLDADSTSASLPLRQQIIHECSYTQLQTHAMQKHWSLTMCEGLLIYDVRCDTNEKKFNLSSSRLWVIIST